VVQTTRCIDDHPVLVAQPVPVEAQRLKVLEGGEAVEFVAQLIVRHNRVSPRGVRAIDRNLDGDPLDAARTYPYVFVGVAVTIVGAEIDANVASIGIVADVLYVVVDGN
jgi:hypothetical protein